MSVRAARDRGVGRVCQPQGRGQVDRVLLERQRNRKRSGHGRLIVAGDDRLPRLGDGTGALLVRRVRRRACHGQRRGGAGSCPASALSWLCSVPVGVLASRRARHQGRQRFWPSRRVCSPGGYAGCSLKAPGRFAQPEDNGAANDDELERPHCIARAAGSRCWHGRESSFTRPFS